MEPYNRRNTTIAGVIVAASVLFGVIGYQQTHAYLFVNISFVIMGITSIVFSHELAMQQLVKYQEYKLNYTFGRSLYVLVGLVFIIGSLLTLVHLL